MCEITVYKLDAHGREVWHYTGRVVTKTATMLKLEAPFLNNDRDLGYAIFRQGDRFVEHFYNDRWYNVFAIYNRADDSLKGWYCNLCRPATWSLTDGIRCEDLALDVWVSPEGETLVLDEDEFIALGLGEAENTAVRHALQTVLDLAQAGQLPR